MSRNPRSCPSLSATRLSNTAQNKNNETTEDQHHRAIGSSNSSNSSSLLARAWASLIRHEFHLTEWPETEISSALSRTLPMLLAADPSSSSFGGIVPFVCRYRQDTIQPLTNAAVQELASWVQHHHQLESLRNKILAALPAQETATAFRVKTSCSRAELNDLYAPYKPESKGSLEQRIKAENPQLVERVDQFWDDAVTRTTANTDHGRNWQRSLIISADDENTITLLANRIAKHMESIDACQEYCDRHCVIEVKKATSKGINNKSKTKDRTNHQDDVTGDDKFQTYHDFECTIQRLRDHQILAIRRGVDQKRLTLKFRLDNDRAELAIRSSLKDRIASPNIKLWIDSIHDAYTRLLHKRCTNRLWKIAGDRASDRGIRVFCDNVRSALLAPPLQPPAPVLSLDPGYKAGIKIAMLDTNGQLLKIQKVEALRTIQFVDDWEKGRVRLVDVMTEFDTNVNDGNWIVALGNGHGTREAQRLAKEALDEIKKPSVEIRLVDEAGASVWSITEAAAQEYPTHPASALASISIGRRLQNPLNELVKIPPKSLGLGMYQHDYTEKSLEERLDAACVDAVAEVGVDGNSCSLEILEKVPGLSRRLAERIIQKRPIQKRYDLLKVSGIGPIVFQSCAAFIRVKGGKEPLDGTLCHPESYDVANFALKAMKWKLSDPLSVASVPRDESKRKDEWKYFMITAAEKFHIPKGRVYSVLVQLVQSIENKDPRLALDNSVTTTATASKLRSTQESGSPLPHDLSPLDKLQMACPVRAINGAIRNIVDFGAFIDIGAESDGLLHISKLGPMRLSVFQIGQIITVDVISVEKQRISLAIPGIVCRQDDSVGSKGIGTKRPRDDASATPKKKRSRVKS